MARPTSKNPKPLPQLMREGKSQRRIYDKARTELIDIGKALRDYPAHGLTKQQQSDRYEMLKGIPKQHPKKRKSRAKSATAKPAAKRSTRAKKKTSP